VEKIKADVGGVRLDVFLTKHFDGTVTRSQITQNIKNGQIRLNDAVVKAGTILNTGDTVSLDIQKEQQSATPEDIKIDVVYQDQYLQIINKPRGMVVHPGAGNRSGTLLNGLLFINREEDIDRGGIVHRLDKNTAGLLVVARDTNTQSKLSTMFERHEVTRTYIGLVEGRLEGSGTIDKNIVRDPNHRTLFKTTQNGGRRAITHYKVLETFARHSLVQFNLQTGRTHQIRVHMKSINHPLCGDPEYNPSSSIRADGQLLESIHLEFTHPITNQKISQRIKPTELFQAAQNKVSKLG
jgi:23S rRNA pseudouridine1911/1915/1917 synthase